jgi:hypothetical protein
LGILPTMHVLSLVLAVALAPQGVPTDTTFVLTAVTAPGPPAIDGALAEGEWDGAALAEGFVQYQPQRGMPSVENTQVLVFQDTEALYVGFRVFDSEEPTAQLTRRDGNLTSDDVVAIILDTYHDRQTGYVFFTNLLGTQQDGRIADDGRTVDQAWDAEWSSAAVRTDFGWTAEFAIPFASLRYEPGEDRTWGINFGRTIRRTFEISHWAGPLENAYRVSQGGQLRGLSLPRPVKPAELIVYGLTHAAEGQEPRWDAGADVRLNPDPSLTINGTLNPDFATIEADREQVNLTRFELSLAEKRPFFLEGNELYRQRIRTFYSRRISDIRGGGRVLGKNGAWTYAAMAVAGEADTAAASPFYSVGSLRRDLGRSTLGLTWADRHLDGSGSGSVGLDATLFFSDRFGFTGQLIQSYGAYSDGTFAFFLRPSYDSPTGHLHVRFTHLGDRFGDNANGIGFIRDDDRRELDSAVEKTLWFDTGFLERLSYDSNYNIYWGQDGTRRSWKIDQGLELQLRNRWALDVSHSEEFKLFEKEFRNRATSFDLGYNTREFTSASAEMEFGRAFDLDFVILAGQASFKPAPESALEYSLEWLSLDPDPENESTWIHVLRGSQFFTNDLYVQAFFQTNSVIDRREAQVVFVYRYKPPFGTVQVAFQRGRADFGERSDQGNTVFVKCTWVF